MYISLYITYGAAGATPLPYVDIHLLLHRSGTIAVNHFWYPLEYHPNANSANAALNKWLKPRLSERCAIRSSRHSLRDRLRAVECPSDIVDAIGGWTTEGIGQRYGKGYDLNIKAKWMGMRNQVQEPRSVDTVT